MYGPTTLPVTGAGATVAAAWFLSPVLGYVLLAATVITIVAFTVSFLYLKSHENRLRVSGRKILNDRNN